MSRFTWNRYAWLLLLCGTLWLSGCMVGPDFRPPSVMMPDAWHQQLEHGEFVGSQELDQWWTMLEDPMLNELIDSVGYSNLDLDAAYARISVARSERCIVTSEKIVQVQDEGSFLTTRTSANSFGAPSGGGGMSNLSSLFSRDLWTLRTSVRWEPDVFGRIHRRIEVADQNVYARVEAYRDLLVALHGDVAETYVIVRTTQAQLEYARENVDIQKQALKLARARVQGGVAANIDEYQAESELAATASRIPGLEQNLHVALNRLSVLMGECPGTLHEPLARPAPIPTVPEFTPVTLPRELLRQRPDIRQAERELAARTAEIGVSTAELFPRFTIIGDFNLQTQDFSRLFEPRSAGYGAGPQFTWPIFQGFRILCSIERAEALVREGLDIYQQTVLLAMEEVEDSIVGFEKAKERRELLKQTVTAAQKSLQSVLALYREGKVDFNNVLNVQRTLFLAQNDLAVTEGEVVTQWISLYRALGGGWDPQHHCPDRVVTARCGPRGDPSIVEDIPAAGEANRYFDLNTKEQDEADQFVEPLPGSEVPTDQSLLSPLKPTDSLSAPEMLPTRGGPEAEGSKTKDQQMFDRVLERLEEKLDSTPIDE